MKDVSNSNKNDNPLKGINTRRALYPVIIGLGVVGYLFYKDFNVEVFQDMNFSWWSVFWLFVALLCMVGRDLGYIIRIRILSDGVLTWRQAFRIIMLWEFTSAITPSAVGGTSVAILYVHKEGIKLGKSSAMVMLTSFLDELYFIIMFPLVIAIVGLDNIFNIPDGEAFVIQGFVLFAVIGYFVKLLYVCFITYGLFVNSRSIKWLILKLFKIGPLRRWRVSAGYVGSDIIESSKELKLKNGIFWIKSFAATFLSWSSRYLVANAIILAFFSVSDQVLLFARQLVMWIMMLIMPTPGGSGFAEYIFTGYCSDLISVPVSQQVGAALLIAFLWRVITYYPYLIIGAAILPKWIKRNFSKESK